MATLVTPIGTRSFTLAAEIRDPDGGTTYATARTVVVGQAPLTDAQRSALAPGSRHLLARLSVMSDHHSPAASRPRRF